MEDTLEEQLEKAFKGCVRIPGMERPSKNKVKEALEVATKKAMVGFGSGMDANKIPL